MYGNPDFLVKSATVVGVLLLSALVLSFFFFFFCENKISLYFLEKKNSKLKKTELNSVFFQKQKKS